MLTVDWFRAHGSKSVSLGKRGVNRTGSQGIDLTGQLFFRWTVLAPAPTPEGLKAVGRFFHARCICGNERVVAGKSLRCGDSKSCGCWGREVVKRPRPPVGPKVDLTGKVFGRWTVLGRDSAREQPHYERTKHRVIFWQCRCSCPDNTLGSVGTSELTGGRSASCGCWAIEKAIATSWEDLGSLQFGHLKVLSFAGSKKFKVTPRPFAESAKAKAKVNSRRSWICQCVCGSIREYSQHTLKRGSSQSCGCRQADKRRATLAEMTSKPAIGLRKFIDGYRRGAKVRKFPWEITKEEVFALVTQNCFYCAKPPHLMSTGAKFMRSSFFANGLDRVDSLLGYSVTNCVPCCKTCNYAKHNMPLIEFAVYHQGIREQGKGSPFEDPEHVHKEWLAKLAARNLPVVQVAA